VSIAGIAGVIDEDGVTGMAEHIVILTGLQDRKDRQDENVNFLIL
jgi:hypothetical protein